MDNQDQQQQQVFEGDFGEADLEADENLDWLPDFDWLHADLPVIPDQENVLLPLPDVPEFIMPLPNIQGEFEGNMLLPQEQEEQPPQEGQFFYDEFGHILTEFVEPEAGLMYPVNIQTALGQNEEGDFVFAPPPY